MRKFLAGFVTIAALLMATTAWGQTLHFISIAWVNAGKQAQYDNFNEKVAPIWRRHGMEVLLRGKVIGALAGDETERLPSEIAVLRVNSRQQFREYIADPSYQAIRPERMESLKQMIVLEGTVSEGEMNPLLGTAPQFVIAFRQTRPEKATDLAVFELNTDQVGSIKGSIPEFFASKPRAELFPLSYDDNPMSFTSPGDETTRLYVLQRIE